MSVNEGANVSLVVTRKGGDIGIVEIRYQVYGDNRNDIRPDNGGKVHFVLAIGIYYLLFTIIEYLECR